MKLFLILKLRTYAELFEIELFLTLKLCTYYAKRNSFKYNCFDI